jgi:hypothetical protein
MSMLTADFMPRGSVSHVLAGLDERAGLVVDELDAATEWACVAEIDAQALVPTQEEIDLGNLAAMRLRRCRRFGWSRWQRPASFGF